MDWLVESARAFVRAQGPNNNYLLAYSGGLDSHVLLHVFATLRQTEPFQLRAIHIHHGIHPCADQWANHCKKICDQLQTDYFQQTIKPFSDRLNLEEKLRQFRYQLFEACLLPDELLLTAHHQNDQAETILLQLCRGAGLKGLSAMPRIKSFGKSFHARPFLDIARQDLLQYAKQHQLDWIEDESNQNTHHTRNFFRHDIIPVLEKRWPSVIKTLARSAKHCADAKHFMEITTQKIVEKCQGTVSATLSVKKLRDLSDIEQRHVLRDFIQQNGFLLPSVVKLQQIIKNLLLAAEDKMPHVTWGDAELRRYRDDLFLMKKRAPHDPLQVIDWDLSTPLTIPGVGVLTASSEAIMSPVTVRFRQGGEMLQLPGRSHRHALKKLFQEWGVLPWLRDLVPLIYADNQLVAVVGYWMAGEWGDHVQIQFRPEGTPLSKGVDECFLRGGGIFSIR
ncbi:MAG TPA: tRNA lysidine(34) synthetase TilS [Gammaproteobacteria bacterium]|nr:tRNA lysidine(34) synthetase TilS [Gammaproteobacteria bacterium]